MREDPAVLEGAVEQILADRLVDQVRQDRPDEEEPVVDLQLEEREDEEPQEQRDADVAEEDHTIE